MTKLPPLFENVKRRGKKIFAVFPFMLDLNDPRLFHPWDSRRKRNLPASPTIGGSAASSGNFLLNLIIY
jgi:hypothetical protein